MMAVVFALLSIGADFDHAHPRWTAVLKSHVKDGVVDYAEIRKNRGPLDTYLADLESVTKADYGGWTEKRKIAFLLNAYNAYTIKLIVDNDPVASIKDLGGFFSSVFSKKFIPLKKLFGKDVSLNAIEHDTLREKFKEPRIHFALVCASKSCPPLRAEAYRAADLAAQLDDQARAFLKDATKNRYDAPRKTLYLSKIFDWFDEDFEAGGGTVRDFVARYLKIPRDVRIRHLNYDWSLNGK